MSSPSLHHSVQSHSLFSSLRVWNALCRLHKRALLLLLNNSTVAFQVKTLSVTPLTLYKSLTVYLPTYASPSLTLYDSSHTQFLFNSFLSLQPTFTSRVSDHIRCTNIKTTTHSCRTRLHSFQQYHDTNEHIPSRCLAYEQYFLQHFLPRPWS